MSFKNVIKKAETRHIEQNTYSPSNDDYNPLENPTIKPEDGKLDFFQKHIKQYTDFISWARWYPDLFLDLMREKDPVTKKPKNGMNLHFDQRVFLRSILRFKSVYGVFPRGWGKCVKGDTYIFTDKGVIPIKSLFECEENGIEDYTKKIDLTIINKNNEREKIDRGVYNGYKKTKKITTAKGYNIECSENHPLIIKKGTHNDFVMASDLRVGDKALISCNNNIWGSNLKLTYNEDDLDDNIKYPKKLNMKIATLIGYLLADGDFSKKNKIIFSSKCEKAIVDYMTYFEDLGLDIWLENNCEYVVEDKNMKKYMQEIGLNFKKDYDKEIPECIMTAPKEIVVATLRGIFDCLSTAREDYDLRMTLKSEKLANQIQLLLLNFGIISAKKNKEEGFEIKFFGKNTRIFIKEIGTNIPSRKNMFDFLLNTYTGKNNNIDNYVYDEIVSIEDGFAHVYDISVPETHSFVSNGFYSHNTWGEVICMFIAAILYPGIQLSMTAQTKGTAADLLQDKYNDIMSKYPLLKNEAYKPKKSKDDFELVFINGSRIDVLANAQQSKGQRRHRMMIEESALLNNEVYEDALKPIVEIGRPTVGTSGMVDPMELNQKNDFFTTSGFRGSTEWERNVRMYKDMVDLKGDIILGSGWLLGSWMGRGSTKSQILDKRSKSTAISFARNYEEKWVGATDNQLVDINKLLKTRTLTNYLKDDLDNEREIILGVDVARSGNIDNNKTIVTVVEEIHAKNGLIKELRLVNMFLISNQLSFTAQTCVIKKIQRQYTAKIVIVDANGLGRGLIDELLKPNIDLATGEEYEAWDTVNGDVKSDYRNAKPILFHLLSQSRDESKKDGRINSYAIINFIDCVESGKLRVLEEKKDNLVNLADVDAVEDFVPFEQTNVLIEEIANLKLLHLSNGEVGVQQVLGKIGKDRFFSLAYSLWWAMSYDNKIEEDETDLILGIAKINGGNIRSSNSINSLFR